MVEGVGGWLPRWEDDWEVGLEDWKEGCGGQELLWVAVEGGWGRDVSVCRVGLKCGACRGV